MNAHHAGACAAGKAKEILQTERLLLRELTSGDFAALCTMLQDAEVMYAYAHAFSGQEAHEWLERQLGRYREYGFGLWAVVLKETGALIGQCGVTMQPLEDGKQVPEVGYLFAKAYWHRGYAIEAAAACKRYAFETLHFPAVYSIIRDTNTASINVALRNGMTEVGIFTKHYYGIDMPHRIFAVRRPS